jgi:Acetyltransferase (GNAT) domain
MQVTVYGDSDQGDWDEFIARSKNGTFLFFRQYMDYHRDRFQDFSLIIRDEDSRILGLLPANREGSRVVSHGGLTYGGFVTDQRMKSAMMLTVMKESIEFLRNQGVDALVYKSIPHIYHRAAAEEDLYALFLAGARLTRCDALAVALHGSPVPMQERRKRGMRKALQQGLTVKSSSDLAQFWEILSTNLRSRYNRLPVHTLQEISMLRDKFPDAIRLFGCFDAASMLAGVVIYETDRVAHAQYTAANEAGKEKCALDLLFHVLLSEVYAEKPCFDFGVSTEHGGRYLNRGLMEQKEGFGARLVAHNHYELDLIRWSADALQADDHEGSRN